MQAKRVITLICGALVELTVLGTVTPSALADSVVCGDILTEDTVLDGDLSCAGTALIIGADDVTLDLNGHTVTSLDGLGVGVDITGGHDGVTIKNGAIDGFQEAILSRDASDLRIEGLTIPGVSGTGTVPGEFGEVSAIHIMGGRKVTITESTIVSGPVFVADGPGPDAINLESVENVRIQECTIDGGFAGVIFGSCGDPGFDPQCPPLSEQPPTTGVVKQCTITNHQFGVILINASGATISENVISDSVQGIRIGFVSALSPSGVRIRENEIFGHLHGVLSSPGPVSDLVVQENHVHHNSRGINLGNVQDSRISENLVENNAVWGINLFGESSGNTVSENTTSGNGVYDLRHSDTSTPNTWRENTCQYSLGADIDCGGGGGGSIPLPVELSSAPRFLRGDCNSDGDVDISDAVCTLKWLFLGVAEPACVAVTNTNGDAGVDISDAAYLLNYLFLGGSEPVAPFPECGPGTLPADETSCDASQLGCQ